MPYGASVYDELGAARPVSWRRQRYAQPMGGAQSLGPRTLPGQGFIGRTGGTGRPLMGFRDQIQRQQYDPAAGSRLPFDPNNPYSFLMGERAASYPGVAARQIGAAGEAGFLNVNDPNFRALYRQRILQGGDARRRRAALLAQLAGLDPEQQRAGLLDADIEASGQTAQQLTDADLQAMLSDRDFARQLLGRSLGFDLDIARMGAEEQAQARAQARQNRGGFGGFIGSAVGAGLGALVGQPGLGASLGGMVGRGRRPRSSLQGAANFGAYDQAALTQRR